jgi:predicted DNA-binding antitoxin AbrB/MazE fold protein
VRTTIEAEVDDQGNIRPKQPVTLAPGSRVLITVIERGDTDSALLSEPALGVDWQRPEEDAAWSHLHQE